MSFNVALAFWAVSILFVITPGADWAFAISAGLKGHVVTPAVIGLVLGHLIATLIVAGGVGTLVAGHAFALSALTITGALYLAWLGINMLTRPSVPHVVNAQASDSWAGWALKGLCVSGLNPKVFLLFLAMLPQFINASASWSESVQMVALGLMHTFSCAIVYFLVGFGSLRVLSTRPNVARKVSRFSGAAMIVIAVVLLTEQLMH